MTIQFERSNRWVVIALILGATSGVSTGQSPSSAGKTPEESAVFGYGAPTALTGGDIIATMLERNRMRNKRLQRYSTVRTYEIRNLQGKLAAQAVVRVRRPARPKKPSFCINRAEVVREYQRIDGFWLRFRDETFVEVKIYGRKVFTVDHEQYVINANPIRDGTRDAGDQEQRFR